MIDSAIIFTVMFIFVRLSAFFIVFNIIFPSGTPKVLKLAIPMILAFAIEPTVSNASMEIINNNNKLLIYFLNEGITGALLGLVTKSLFQILKLAGSWIDLHIGFSMLSLADASASSTTTVTGKLLEYCTLVLFFITDAHHLIIKSLIESFSVVSVGSSIISSESMMESMQIIIEYFFMGIKIALPIVIIIIMTDICMGLVSRVVPQINVMILGMPVKMIVGLLMITLSIAIINKVFIGALSYLPSVIRRILNVAPVALIFMSDDKTEEATPKKKSDARKKGQIAKSKDVGIALTTIATLLVIMTLSDKIINNFKEIIISEEVAISKPNAEIFHHALNKINYHDKKKVLMVGDSLTSDIQGGINAGIDTCWYNPNEYINNTNIKPTYEIKSLFQLRELLK